MNTDEQVETMRQVLGDALAKQMGIGYYYVTAETARAALAVVPMPEWQPIETAPKDGTVILVCGNNARGVYYVTDAKWSCGAWCLFDCAEDSHTYPSDYHTHWQPLPTPPERAGK